MDKLFEAGCGDASPLIGKIGGLGMMFHREAESAEAALKSAISNVKKAIPQAELARAEPDLVNLTEMAELAGTTKQNLRKYAKGETAKVSDPFPIPRVAGKTDYWHGDELARWLLKKTNLTVTPNVLETLTCARGLNLSIDMHKSKQFFR